MRQAFLPFSTKSKNKKNPKTITLYFRLFPKKFVINHPNHQNQFNSEKTMKFSKTVFIVATLTASALTTNKVSTANLFVGCVDIYQRKCAGCFKRQVRADDNGCGPLQPQNDTCLFYTYSPLAKSVQCSQCKPGYPRHVFAVNDTIKVNYIKGTIPDCFSEVDTDYLQPKQTRGSALFVRETSTLFLTKGSSHRLAKKAAIQFKIA